jgi:hypothetical protein
MKTLVYQGDAAWNRLAYLKLVDDKVVFDCSDEEYSSIEFDLEILVEALSKHYYAKPISCVEWHKNRDKMAEEYQQIEAAITNWYNDNLIMNGIANKTAGELTLQIIDILNKKDSKRK